MCPRFTAGWPFADALCAQLECGEYNTLRTNLPLCLTTQYKIYLNLKWRASLVPAAAVIPAPLAYTIIVAVKRLVVGLNNHYFIIILFWFLDIAYIKFFFNNNTMGRDRKFISLTPCRNHMCGTLSILKIYTHHTYAHNTVNKSKCTKHVFLRVH